MMKKTMPAGCPSCRSALKVVKLACDDCGTTVEGDFQLPVLARLDAEDQAFLLSFLNASGSLKDMARLYGISYPTVRNRLDVLIEKVRSMGPDSAKHKGE